MKLKMNSSAKQFGFVLSCLLSISVFDDQATGQAYRESLSYRPQRVFRDMLRLAESEDYERLKASFQFIGTLVAALSSNDKTDYKAKIITAAANSDKKQAVEWTYRLIFSDMRDLLQQSTDQIFKESYARAAQCVRLAYDDYLLMSPLMETEADKQVRDLFRELQANINKDKLDVFKQNVNTISNMEFRFSKHF